MPDSRGLAESELRELVHRLVGEGAGARHHTDAAGLVDMAGHDPDLALARGDEAGAVGPEQAGLGLVLQVTAHLDHVEDRYSLGDADHERNASLGCLDDGIRGEGRRDEDRRSVGGGLAYRSAGPSGIWEPLPGTLSRRDRA